MNELKIFVPVYNLKAGLSRITLVVDNIKHKIRKIRVYIYIDRVYIRFVYFSFRFVLIWIYCDNVRRYYNVILP